MTPEVLFDLVFLLLFTLCEVLGILYYLAPLRPVPFGVAGDGHSF